MPEGADYLSPAGHEVTACAVAGLTAFFDSESAGRPHASGGPGDVRIGPRSASRPGPRQGIGRSGLVLISHWMMARSSVMVTSSMLVVSAWPLYRMSLPSQQSLWQEPM